MRMTPRPDPAQTTSNRATIGITAGWSGSSVTARQRVTQATMRSDSYISEGKSQGREGGIKNLAVVAG
jgi:hypothetical protein